MIAMLDLLSALGLVLALEGALYAGFPSAMRRTLAAVEQQSDQVLRMAGLAALGCGFIIVWFVRG